MLLMEQIQIKMELGLQFYVTGSRNNYDENKMMSENFVKNNPFWKLSLQTHKILGFP